MTLKQIALTVGLTLRVALCPARPLTVCEVLEKPLEFNGKVITIRARESGTNEGAWLVDDSCPGIFVSLGHTWPSEISLAFPGDRLNLHAIDFQYDWLSERRFRKAYKRLRRKVKENCMLSTLTGMFETREDWSPSRAVYPNGSTKLKGFGHLGEAPGQLILKSSDSISLDPYCKDKQEKSATSPR